VSDYGKLDPAPSAGELKKGFDSAAQAVELSFKQYFHNKGGLKPFEPESLPVYGVFKKEITTLNVDDKDVKKTVFHEHRDGSLIIGRPYQSEHTISRLRFSPSSEDLFVEHGAKPRENAENFSVDSGPVNKRD
jgi:hypothetical protein